MSSLYDYTVTKPNGEQQSLREYEEQVILIVNTASKCGFTPQFEGLQELYTKYHDRGFVVLGFPCDQFNNQEFDNIEETTQFCQVNYGVTFPMFAKVDVNGDKADPLFVFLRKQKRGILLDQIKWNFTKFLIDRTGQVVERYAPTTEPVEIEKNIVNYLG